MKPWRSGLWLFGVGYLAGMFVGVSNLHHQAGRVIWLIGIGLCGYGGFLATRFYYGRWKHLSYCAECGKPLGYRADYCRQCAQRYGL